jgi:hypothetical protein
VRIEPIEVFIVAWAAVAVGALLALLAVSP